MSTNLRVVVVPSNRQDVSCADMGTDMNSLLSAFQTTFSVDLDEINSGIRPEQAAEAEHPPWVRLVVVPLQLLIPGRRDGINLAAV
jgi:hypothetical protein